MFQKVDAYAGDPILTLMERFKEDPRSDKVNLSIGLYYNEEGIIPQLKAVADAEARLNAQPHGASLYFHYSWVNWQKHAVSPFVQVKDHVLLPEASGLEEADAEMKRLLTEEKIREIVALIPDDWLHWSESPGRPQEIREIYIRFLCERLAHSETFIKEAQDARKALI